MIIKSRSFGFAQRRSRVVISSEYGFHIFRIENPHRAGPRNTYVFHNSIILKLSGFQNHKSKMIKMEIKEIEKVEIIEKKIDQSVN